MRTYKHRTVACSCMFICVTTITNAPTFAAPPVSTGELKMSRVDVVQPIAGVNEIVSTILDSSEDSTRRYEAFNTLLRSVEPQERFRSLFQILEQPDHEFGVMAAMALLSEPNLNADTISRISEAAQDWPSNELLILIGNLSARVYTRDLRPIAKTILMTALDRIDRDAQQTDIELPPVAGRAFQFVCDGDNSCPRNLVERMFRTLPQSREMWFALACYGGILEKDVPLGTSIYLDKDLPLRTRHAAASAIASLYPAAKQYLGESLNNYFQEMAAYPLLSDLPHMYKLDDAAIRYREFRERLHVLELLMCLDEPMARKMVFTQFDKQNEIVRSVLVVIAALRWPEKILKLAESRHVPEVDDRALALIAMTQQKLKKRCLLAGDSQRIEDFLVKFHKDGWHNHFGQIGNIVRGF